MVLYSEHLNIFRSPLCSEVVCLNLFAIVLIKFGIFGNMKPAIICRYVPSLLVLQVAFTDTSTVQHIYWEMKYMFYLYQYN
jgi:hypothetical protein